MDYMIVTFVKNPGILYVLLACETAEIYVHFSFIYKILTLRNKILFYGNKWEHSPYFSFLNGGHTYFATQMPILYTTTVK